MSDKIREALEGMLAIHDEPSGFAGKYGRALDEAIAAQKVKIDQRVAAARAALTQQPAPVAAPDGWRPIETAPKNGMEIILRKGGRVTAGAWAEWSTSDQEFHSTTGAWLGNVERDSGAGWASWDGGFAEGDEPEQWMPLPSASPAPPTAEQPDTARSLLIDRDMHWLRRFQECCEDPDADGQDLPKSAVRDLQLIGALRNAGFGRSEITKFGEYLLAGGEE